MTILVAINTPDAVVMGSDSLGTITRRFIAPDRLTGYFDTDNSRKLKLGADGQPLLDTWSKVAGQFVEVPYKSHTDVEKILSLEPLKIGAMVYGIASIGSRTIKSLFTEFKDTAAFAELALGRYTVQGTAAALLSFFHQAYLEKYPPEQAGPELEIIVCGYDSSGYTPGVARVYVHRKLATETDYDYCIFLGGTAREVQRLLFGIDSTGKSRLVERSKELLEKYHGLLVEQLKDSGVAVELKRPEEFEGEFSLFQDWRSESLEMNCATYSEQDAIDCADFLVNVMIKSQRYSNQLPSTGGRAQIAVIDKHSGFRLVSPPARHPDISPLTH